MITMAAFAAGQLLMEDGHPIGVDLRARRRVALNTQEQAALRTGLVEKGAEGGRFVEEDLPMPRVLSDPHRRDEVLEGGGVVEAAACSKGAQDAQLDLVGLRDFSALRRELKQGRGIVAGGDGEPDQHQALQNGARACPDESAPVGKLHLGTEEIAGQEGDAGALEGDPLGQEAGEGTAAQSCCYLVERRCGGARVST